MRNTGPSLRGAWGLAVAQLRYYRVRTALAVLAIALAVLSGTLLASLGIGVLETGTEKFEQSQQDLWVTGGPIRLAPGTVGGIENSLTDSHELGRSMERRAGIREAAPIAYQTVYIGTNTSSLRSVVGVGVPNVGILNLKAGEGFTQSDIHYNEGRYDGPMTYSVVIDPRTAAMFDVGVGDQLYLGGTVASAREHAFTVVGISPTFSGFLGTPTVAVHLSELQEVSGTTGTDRASVIAVSLKPGVDARAIEQDLQNAYPAYTIRTNREQLAAVLEERAIFIAAGTIMVILALVSGIALTTNVLALIVHQQREQLAAAKAVGLSSATLVGVVGIEAVLLGGLGGLLGLGATPVVVALVNAVVEQLVGFGNLARTPVYVYVIGGGIAIGIGLLAGSLTAWRVLRISPLDQLQE